MNLMPKLSRKDLYSLEEYSEIRDDFRARVIAHKKNRTSTWVTIWYCFSRTGW